MTRSHLLVLSALLTGAPTLARAHAQLQTSDPAVGSIVRTAPEQVAITFSEAVEPRFSSIAVTDGAGRSVTRGAPHTAGGDGRRLLMEVDALPAGTYRVEWHATSVDTHKTEGSFGFTVAP